MAQAMKTGIIRFNLKERMRQYNGQERHFDIPKLVKEINSPRVQERVKLGDLNGFYGHWVRTKFGLDPQEGGIVDGAVINIEPSFRTVHLKAYADGTVEHQAEFFANDAGSKAFAQLQEKSGGFSSVIRDTGNGYQFYGFDFVREPNFSGNRPYTLDSTTGEPLWEESAILVLDGTPQAVADNEQADYIAYLEESVRIYQDNERKLVAENQQLAQSLSHSVAQQAVLMDDIFAKETALNQAQQAAKFESVALDSAIAQANTFKTAKLEQTEEQAAAEKIGQLGQNYENWLKGYGY